jgi:hypothetical protein
MPTRRGDDGGKPGIGIDAFNREVIDPTKNVESLVRAESDKRDAFRIGDKELFDAKIESLKELAAAETRRINELRAQKSMFDAEMARVLRINVEEVKRDLQVELRSLNQFRWESGGKTAGVGNVGTVVLGLFVALSTMTAVGSLIVTLTRAPPIP